MDWSVAILLIHLVSTCFMLGVIWFVQVVHYPLFASVGYAQFPAYEKEHCRLTGFIVGPAMFAELSTAVLLFAVLESELRTLLTTNIVCLALIWLSTLLLQMPAHLRLESAFHNKLHSRLVVSNWLRTALWSVRAVIVVLLLVRIL